MQSGLIDKDGKILECEYYEIEALCIKIVENYCLEDENNNKHFLEFARDYTYFSPYFDFVVGVLGYSLINPLLQRKMILSNIPGTRKYILKKYNQFLEEYIPLEYGKVKIVFSSDKDLQIEPFDEEKNDYKCFITEHLTSIVPPIGHRELAKQLLNLGMLKDKELCEKIALVNINVKDMAEVLMWYFPLLRYERYNENDFLLIYRSDNIKEQQNSLVKKFKLKNKDFVFNQVLRSSADVCDWSNKFYNERVDKYDNRRI